MLRKRYKELLVNQMLFSIINEIKQSVKENCSIWNFHGRCLATTSDDMDEIREDVEKFLQTEDCHKTQITERTAEALKNVMESLNEVREGTMASAQMSEEQAEAMRGIEAEIRQITDVVQSNSATAQESSAICEELTAQAVGLNELVEEFSIE